MRLDLIEKVVLKKYFDSIAQWRLKKLHISGAHTIGFDGLLDRYRLFVSKYKMRIVLGLVNAQPGLRICDIGCGPGEYVVEFLRRGATVTGVDFSVKMVKLTKKNLLEHGMKMRASVLVADAEKIVPKGFSVVTVIGVLGYYPDCKKLLGNIKEALNPGGKLIIDFPHLLQLSTPLKKLYYLLNDIPHKLYTKRSLRETLVNQGFKVIKIKRSCGSMFALAVVNK